MGYAGGLGGVYEPGANVSFQAACHRPCHWSRTPIEARIEHSVRSCALCWTWGCGPLYHREARDKTGRDRVTKLCPGGGVSWLLGEEIIVRACDGVQCEADSEYAAEEDRGRASSRAE